jgi:hypothetical protein
MGARITAPKQIFPLPNPYAGEQSVKFPNGLIFKQGTITKTGTNTTVTFAVAFPTAIINAWACQGEDSGDFWEVGAHTLAVASMIVKTGSAGTVLLRWFAIGY